MSFGEDIKKLVERHSQGRLGTHPTWARVRAGDIAELTNGFAYKSANFGAENGTPLLRIRDILTGMPGTFYDAPVDDPKMKSVEDGDIVIGMDGDFNSRIWRGGKALINQRVCTIRADKRFYSQKLLAYALPGYLSLINDYTSSVTVKHLSSRTVQDIPLPLPPLNEQHRIVEKIETLFARIDKGEQALREVQKLLKRYRQSILKAAVTGELTRDWREANQHKLEPASDLLARILKVRRENWQGRGKYKEPGQPDTTDLPSLPIGWIYASGAQLFAWSSGKFLPKKCQTGGNTPVYGGNGITGYHDQPLIDEPTIVIGRVGAHCGNVHCTCEPAWVTDNAIYATQLPADCRVDFLAEVFRNTKLGQKSKGGAQPFVNQEALNNTIVPLPPAEEQIEIMDCIEAAYTNANTIEGICEAELTRSTALRHSILKSAFTGQLVPQDPNDEPASELLARIRAEREEVTKKRSKKKASRKKTRAKA